ncbi:MAG: uroporphyrinogen decarboxylase family protein [Candidatus Brocadiia bacterium]|nr:uroporphyrinogen decarboxylase family protein [Candidatus Brocadiia bacterium]
MDSRERVLKAVNFEKPDSAPIDLGAMRASGISAVLYSRLKEHLGIRTPTKICDIMQILAEIEPEVRRRLHIDVIPLETGAAGWPQMDANAGVGRRLFDGTEVFFPPGVDITEEEDGSWLLRRPDGTPYARMPGNGFYFDFLRTTMSRRRIDPDAFQPSRTVPEEELELLAQHARHLYENTDKALLGWGGSISLVGLSALLAENITQGALDEWLCMLAAEKETAHEMMDRYVDAAIAKLKLYHEAVGDRCFAWGIASDDAGTQRGGIMAPELFGEMIAPHYARLCDWVHANTNWKTFLHSCGSVYHYIPHWIEAGVDILNPVQISAVNMEPERLKAEFGGRIVFWGGGCDTQKLLPFGTPAEVREHVRHNIEVFGAGGGFVFTQVHNIQHDVPLENVLAMFEAAREFGEGAPREGLDSR